jgi:baseplate J-like protein
MSDETQLIYLEPDDEITTVVRRLREADAPRLVLVSSGRTKATTSAVALRLLAQVAAEEGREVVLVADASARALAAQAGIPAFASVADANAEGAVPTPAPAPAAAPIHVVRGDEAPALVDEPLAPLPPAAAASRRAMEETQAVRLPPPAPPPARSQRPRGPQNQRARPTTAGFPVALLIGLLALLLAAGVAAATVLPAATITIHLRPIAVGPVTYSLTPEVHPADGELLSSTMEGEATGHRTRRTAATGRVLLINYSGDNVLVPGGTVVSAGGEILFQTTQAVTVPDANFFFPGTATTTVEALEPGFDGNVEALAIDSIEDRDVDRALRGPGPDERRIRNDEPITGGDERELVFVRKSDVDAVTEAIRTDLQQQFESAMEGLDDRIYAADAPTPRVKVPGDLIGQVSDEDPLTFQLTGRLVDERPYLLRADVEDVARQQLLADAEATPEGATLDEETIAIELDDASAEGGVITVVVTVNASATADVDIEVLQRELAGMSEIDAEAALAEIGPSSVELWPWWVDRIPRFDWRVSIDVRAADQQS